jgi:hypothetical protein
MSRGRGWTSDAYYNLRAIMPATLVASVSAQDAAFRADNNLTLRSHRESDSWLKQRCR